MCCVYVVEWRQMPALPTSALSYRLANVFQIRSFVVTTDNSLALPCYKRGHFCSGLRMF